MQTVNLVIKGKVQGVYFRASAKEVADRLGVKGWVKNTGSGDVEIVGSGTQKQLQEFIEWCQNGPSMSQVTDVIVTEIEWMLFEDFKILR